jgi:hypothetical protein
LKKNSLTRGIQKPEVGNYYRNYRDYVFKILSVDENIGEATIQWCGSKDMQIWDYIEFPECLDNKLSPLEVELL